LQLPVKNRHRRNEAGHQEHKSATRWKSCPTDGQLIVKTLVGGNYTAVLSIRDSGPGYSQRDKGKYLRSVFYHKSQGHRFGLGRGKESGRKEQCPN